MIDPKELRIGNLILLNGVITEIYSIHTDNSINQHNDGFGIYGNDNLENAFGIELSMDILRKCTTFSQDRTSWEKDTKEFWCYLGGARFKLLLESDYEGGDMFAISYGTSVGFECYDFGYHVEYLHELQNLYYFLVHEELKINL